MLRNLNLFDVTKTYANKKLQNDKVTGHEITSVLFRCRSVPAEH